jgi:predicted nucleic acid-binding protein
MPSSDLVVSDTSPLLNLALIDQLDLLRAQFSGISIPDQVWGELTEGDAGLNALRELRDEGFLNVVEVERSDLFIEIRRQLDCGETAAICYAIGQDAELILLDEKEGRRVARDHGLTVTGVIGVLLKGANAGNVDLERELAALREAGFWISDAQYSQVLKNAEK